MAALLAAKVRVATYTSPRQWTFEADGRGRRDDLVGRRRRVRSTHSRDREVGAASSKPRPRWHSLFRARARDVAVIETGLGGRLDSTNVLDPSSPASRRSVSITGISDRRSRRSPAKAGIAAGPAAVIGSAIPDS
jgi:hypothetical protein